MKSHYRVHQLSLWLHLVPTLDQPGVGVPNSHHLFDDLSVDDTYDGLVRTMVFTKPTSTTTPAATVVSAPAYAGNGSESAAASSSSGRSPQQTPDDGVDGDDRQRDAHVYTTALAVTIGIGLSLLLINILIFAGVYYQTRRRSLTSMPQVELPQVGKCKENGSVPTPGVSIGVDTFGGTAVVTQQQQRRPIMPYPPTEFADLPGQQEMLVGPSRSGTLPRARCVEFQDALDFRDARALTLDKRKMPSANKPVCSCETDPLLLQSIHLVNASGAQQLQAKGSQSVYKDVRV